MALARCLLLLALLVGVNAGGSKLKNPSDSGKNTIARDTAKTLDSEAREKPLLPVVFLHGFAGTLLDFEASDHEMDDCPKNDEGRLWLQVPIPKCTYKHMRLQKNGQPHGTLNIKPHFPQGDVRNIRRLMLSEEHGILNTFGVQGSYAKPFVSALRTIGYKPWRHGIEDGNLFAYAYDFRRGDQAFSDQVQAELTEMIEKASALNFNLPVLVVTHSLGCLTMLRFINHPSTTQAWLDKYLHSWWPVGGPFLGAVKMARLLIAGENFDTSMIDPVQVNAASRTWPTSFMTLPTYPYEAKLLFPAEESNLLIRSDEQFEVLLSRFGDEESEVSKELLMMGRKLRTDIGALRKDVRIRVVAGDNQATEATIFLKFKKAVDAWSTIPISKAWDAWQSDDVSIFDNRGDGTVELKSATAIKTNCLTLLDCDFTDCHKNMIWLPQFLQTLLPVLISHESHDVCMTEAHRFATSLKTEPTSFLSRPLSRNNLDSPACQTTVDLEAKKG